MKDLVGTEGVVEESWTEFGKSHQKSVGEAVVLAYRVAILSHLMFLLVDAWVFPEAMGRLRSVRLVFVGLHLGSLCWLSIRPKNSYMTSGLCMASICIGLALVIIATGEPNSPYFQVLPLVYLCVSNFLPTRAWDVARAQGMVTIFYGFLALAGFSFTDLGLVSLQIGTMAIALGVSAVSVLLRNRAAYREYCLKIDLQLKADELKTANEVLAASAEALREMDKLKSDLFANISHDLRTPLSVIMSNLDLIDDEANAGHHGLIAKHAKSARLSALRLVGLVRDILDLTRADMRKFRLVLEDVDLFEMLTPIIEDISILAKKKDIEVLLTSPKLQKEKFLVKADRGQIDRVFINLLTNSLKFTPPGGKVMVRLQEYQDRVEVLFSDTGAGIDPKVIPFLFKRGVQEAGHALADGLVFQEGLGIGLSLIHMIVSAHQGEVSVTSQLGKGSEFRIALWRMPSLTEELIERRVQMKNGGVERRRADQVNDLNQKYRDDLRYVEARGLTEHGDLSQVGEDKRGRATILVVDDSRDLVALLVEILGDYRVVCAESGAEGLAAARRVKPDLVVTDMMMRDGNGLDLLKNLRADKELRDIPVILATASGVGDHQAIAAEWGVDGYVEKPFEARLVRAMVGRLLHREEEVAKRMVEKGQESLDLLVRGFSHNILNALQYVGSSLNLFQHQVEEMGELLDIERRQHFVEEGRAVFVSGSQGIGRVQESIQVLQKMVDRSGGVELEILAVSEVVERAVLTVGGREITKVNGATNAHVSVRRGQVEDVIINLIKNAHEAAGGPCEVTIALSDDEPRQGVSIEVSDMGPGMSTETLRRAFEPNFTTKPKGSGLGLAVSRLIIRQHGGEITVKSVQGEGSCFYIWLPVVRK